MSVTTPLLLALGERSGGLGSERKGTPHPSPPPLGAGELPSIPPPSEGITFNSSPQRGEVRRGAELMRTGTIMEHVRHHSPAPPLGERSEGLGSERKGTPPSQPAPAGDGGITFNSSPQRGEVRRGAEARWAGCIRSTSVTTPPTEAEQGLGGKVKGGSQPTCTPSTA